MRSDRPARPRGIVASRTRSRARRRSCRSARAAAGRPRRTTSPTRTSAWPITATVSSRARRIQQRLRWHLHQVEPAFVVHAKELDRQVQIDRVGRWLARRLPRCRCGSPASSPCAADRSRERSVHRELKKTLSWPALLACRLRRDHRRQAARRERTDRPLKRRASAKRLAVSNSNACRATASRVADCQAADGATGSRHQLRSRSNSISKANRPKAKDAASIRCLNELARDTSPPLERARHRTPGPRECCCSSDPRIRNYIRLSPSRDADGCCSTETDLRRT